MAVNYIEILELADQGRWAEAHESVQPHSDRMACLVHGYLHRLEGDLNNARYWYNRAGERMSDNALEEEWRRLKDLAGSE